VHLLSLMSVSEGPVSRWVDGWVNGVGREEAP